MIPLAAPLRSRGALAVSAFKFGAWKNPNPAPQIAKRQVMSATLACLGSSPRSALPRQSQGEHAAEQYGRDNIEPVGCSNAGAMPQGEKRQSNGKKPRRNIIPDPAECNIYGASQTTAPVLHLGKRLEDAMRAPDPIKGINNPWNLKTVFSDAERPRRT
jgi:hypothetical protein